MKQKIHQESCQQQQPVICLPWGDIGDMSKFIGSLEDFGTFRDFGRENFRVKDEKPPRLCRFWPE